MIERFPQTLEEALQIVEKTKFTKHSAPLRSIFISGLGGSGIGGNFVASFVADSCKLPITVNKGYDVPNWINKHTLAIFSSYSGGTEETLHAFKQVIALGAKVLCVTSGGKLLELARQHGCDYVQLPGGWTSPRACMGFSITAQLGALRGYNLIPSKILKEVAASAAFLEKNKATIQKDARKLAEKLGSRHAVLYVHDRMEPVAIRWRQQINENSKLLCWHHVIPEMNHNEIVGWQTPRPDVCVFWLRSSDELPRNQIRTDIVQKLIASKAGASIQIQAKGRTAIQQAFYLVNLGDYFSYYLAEIRGVNPIEIPSIDFLKAELAKIDF